MPRSNVPDTLRPFLFHGVHLDGPASTDQAVGDCVLCGREGRFYIGVKTGQWDCKRCGAEGNALTFLRQLWEASAKALDGTEDREFSELAQDRRLASPSSLVTWGVRRSAATGEWIFPGYDTVGNLVQLYRYVSNQDPKSKRKWLVLATPTFSHGLLGVPLRDEKSKVIFLCEGLWDALVLWEALGSAKLGLGQDGRPRSTTEGLTDIPVSAWIPITLTGSREGSLLSVASVLATPSCRTFPEDWSRLFAGRAAILLFDSDHPLRHPQTGALGLPVGFEAMKRVAQILARAEEPVVSISYLKWGPSGYDPLRPSGYDVRDLLTGATS